MSQFNNVHGKDAFAGVEDSQLFTELTDEQGAMVEGGARILLFEHANFQGQARLIDGPVENLKSVRFNDKVSSMIVLEGEWKFYRDSDFRFAYEETLGPGSYSFVEDVKIKNDDLSSLKPV